MFRRILKRRAQTTLEYAVLIGVIVGGLVAMQIYLKRGWQGKLRDSADNMGGQFSPEHTEYSYTTTSNTVSSETLNAGTSTTNITAQNSNKSGSETVEALENEKVF